MRRITKFAEKDICNKKKAEWLERVEEICFSSNIISVNNGNRKTGKGCLTLSFPTCTCLDCAPCKQSGKCYCLHFPQSSAQVQGAYYKNLRIWNEDPECFEKQLNAIITINGIGLFRYNDCGDIPSESFFEMMIRVAKAHPEVKFLSYTKKYSIVNNVLDKGCAIPENLTVRFSYWDKNWKVNNPHNLPVAYVDFKDSSMNPAIPQNAFKCKGGKETTCSMCRVCFNKKVQAVKFLQH